MFAKENEGELKSMLHRARETLLECVATIMYDSAVLPAEQLGEKVLPEPFSKKQQLQSRLDGGEEIDGSRRQLLEVTAPDPQGHVVRERTIAEAEQRTCRNFYREVPLTGCQQSMMPTYPFPQAFGRKAILDDCGLCEPIADAEELGASTSSLARGDNPWIEEEDGKISGV